MVFENDIPNKTDCQCSLKYALPCQSCLSVWISKCGSLLLGCTLAVQMLLMLAGDVERNPGPGMYCMYSLTCITYTLD